MGPKVIEEACQVLERTPGTVDQLLRGLPDDWLHANEGGESWSPFDVVGHLLHGERTDWITRARIILEHGPHRAFDPFDRFAQLEANRGRSIDELLDEFARLRPENVATLRAFELTEQDLDRPGRHPNLGAVTLGQLISTWVVHDLGHIAQIGRVLAHRHRDEVGAWRDYLPILQPRG